MATPSTSAVCIHVIEDVMEKVREEFINNGGPGEGVLAELQGLWELKMMQCGVISGPIERSSLPKSVGGSIAPVHDLNVPYEGTEEYETPTADILFPPTPIQTPIQTPLPGTMDQSPYNIPTGSSDFPTVLDTGSVNEVKGGRPSPYMVNPVPLPPFLLVNDNDNVPSLLQQPPSPWMNQRPLGVDVNVAYVEGQNEVDRGTSHQPMTQDFFMPSGKRKREDFAPHFHNGGYIPQKDGAGDAVPELFKSEPSRLVTIGYTGSVLVDVVLAL
ncbi:hypothetical protein HHK36_016347 [Tetracentron sinense]|uniref:Uncharacterized protein n=1 Tax=Tetracentron sinense TaxID=13715 RepID=A0A834Z552_TETSI|nr:hypothetical protein HHK36_016347 [Tetracentron sinense]